MAEELAAIPAEALESPVPPVRSESTGPRARQSRLRRLARRRAVYLLVAYPRWFPGSFALEEHLLSPRYLAARPDVDRSRIVIHGRSLGTGVASQLAGRHQPAALILESPFTSVASFAWRYGVPPVFLKSPYRTDEVLPKLTCPILILAGRDDE